MFLSCSYFFGNLSLNVLINMVLTQKNQCIAFNNDAPHLRPLEKITFDRKRFIEVLNFLFIVKNYNMQMRFLVTSLILPGIV